MTQSNKTVSIKESLVSVVEHLETLAKQPVDDLFNKDFMQIGKSDLYLHKQDLVILTGQKYSRKTSLALSIVRKLAVESNRVMGFISCCELDASSITLRLLAQKAEVSLSKLRCGLLKKQDVDKIQTAAEKLFDAPIFINEFPASVVTYKDLEAEIENMVENHNVEAVFIDSLECIKDVSNQKESGMLFKKLKVLSEELNIAIVLISPLEILEKTSIFYLKKIVRNDDVDMLFVLNREFNKDENVKVQPCNLSVEKDTIFGVRDVALSFTLNSARFDFEEESYEK